MHDGRRQERVKLDLAAKRMELEHNSTKMAVRTTRVRIESGSIKLLTVKRRNKWGKSTRKYWLKTQEEKQARVQDHGSQEHSFKHQGW